MVEKAELKTIVEANDYADYDGETLSKASPEQLDALAQDILANAENIQQVKVFPDKRKSLDLETKQKIASWLTSEIQDCIDELSDLWYNPEITEKETNQLTALEYVIDHKDKIPQSFVKLEEKANEIAKSIGVEIEEKWILDNAKADHSQTTASTDDYGNVG